MNLASFRFYAELNDFLPEELRGTCFQHRFWGCPGVKDVIEALGPPHTEINLILINGKSAGFGHGLEHADRVSVFPRFQTLDIRSIKNVRPPDLHTMRFVLDTHLGRLAAYLRMLGFDSLYWNDARDERLAKVSGSEKRILLTRDRGLLKRTSVVYGYCVRSTAPRGQLIEVVRHFQLQRAVQPFKRCMRCNGILRDVDKARVVERLPEGVRENQDAFRVCEGCDRIYWRGSHYNRMRQLLWSVTGEEVDPESAP